MTILPTRVTGTTRGPGRSKGHPSLVCFRSSNDSRYAWGLLKIPKWLSEPTLRYFSALTILQELGIDRLRVSDFMPTIRQCFGHFSPTLRFLALEQPIGSCRHILIRFFPNLQDLRLHYPFPRNEEDGSANPMLVPPSVPPLRGRLTLPCFTRENLLKDMVTFLADSVSVIWTSSG